MRLLAAAVALIALLAAGLAGSAAARRSAHRRAVLVSETRFRPRVGRAFGLVPPAGSSDIAVGQPFPEVYNGGPVMRGVRVHTVFWAPNGFSFDGSPGPGVLGFVPLIQQFLTDVAHDSGSTGNVFSVLNQYGDRSGAGAYRIARIRPRPTRSSTPTRIRRARSSARRPPGCRRASPTWRSQTSSTA